MLSLSTITAFFTASLFLALTPGPDNIFVLTQSMQNGRKSGFIITIGLCTGLLFHTSLAAFGIAAILKASPTAFNLLKYAGAAYLLYLAFLSFKAPAKGKNIENNEPIKISHLYRRGIIMNITNPKVTLFFLAFLPQFTNEKNGEIWMQMIFLGSIFILATMLIFGLISQLSGFIGEKLFKSPTANFLLDKISAFVFVALALNLIFISI